MNNTLFHRIGHWFHVIQTELPSGKSQVLATLCNRRSVETLLGSLQKNRETSQRFVYTIDPFPAPFHPLRRCDTCTCVSSKG
jgi:hypothetical protein